MNDETTTVALSEWQDVLRDRKGIDSTDLLDFEATNEWEAILRESIDSYTLIPVCVVNGQPYAMQTKVGSVTEVLDWATSLKESNQKIVFYTAARLDGDNVSVRYAPVEETVSSPNGSSFV